MLDSTFKEGGQELNRIESTELSRATTVVYTQEYPIILPVVGIGQMSRLNARGLPLGSLFR